MAHQYMDQVNHELSTQAFIVAHVRSPLFKCRTDDYFFQIINFTPEKNSRRKSEHFKCQSNSNTCFKVYQLAYPLSFFDPRAV